MTANRRSRHQLALSAAAVIAAGAASAAPSAAAGPTKAQCIAASEQGQEARHAGRLREAREQLTLCVASSCPGPVREDCAQLLGEVARAMPSVVFEVKDAAGADLLAAKVEVDGQPIVSTPDVAIELDPGEHSFVVEAAGLKNIEKTLVVVEGVKQRREVVVMGPPAAPTATTSSPSTGKATTTSAGPPPLSWVAFGVGGAGLAIGIIMGLVATSKHSDLSNVCSDATGTCPSAASGDLDAFHTWRTLSTFGYVLAGLGAAAGGLLWYLAPKSRGTTTAGAWVGPAAAGVGGTF